MLGVDAGGTHAGTGQVHADLDGAKLNRVGKQD